MARGARRRGLGKRVEGEFNLAGLGSRWCELKAETAMQHDLFNPGTLLIFVC